MLVLAPLSFRGLLRSSRRSIKGITLLLPLMLSSVALSGCFTGARAITDGELSPNTQGPSALSEKWLSSGSLALSRPVPAPNLFNANSTSPTPFSNQSMTDTLAASLIISRKDKTVTALRPGQSPIVFKTEGTDLMKPGSYSVTVKEENPLWYAPKAYFVNRSLVIPAEGSRERFKRAALGSKTLFLNDQTPIHSGPIWMKEIGGVRINQQQMSQIFSCIDIGTPVEVR